MLVQIDHINVHSRMDGGPKPFDPTKVTTYLQYYDDSEVFMIEITDPNNPEFRVMINISQNELDRAKTSPKKGL